MRSIKSIIAGVLLALVGTAHADYTLVVPQEAGGGLSVWAEIVVRELNKYTNEPVRIRHIPGAGTVLGVNEWHTDLRKDPKVMVAVGGANAIKYLTNAGVKYDYSYDAIGVMNLNIVVARRTNTDRLIFPAGDGHTPEAMAMLMLAAGPGLTTDQYIDYWKRNVKWVPAMKQADFRLSFRRGELTGTRENPAAWKKHVQPLIDAGEAELWFHHGLLNAKTGKHDDDVNFPGHQMEILFKKKWGVEPSGELYQAYRMNKSYRDGIQKALFINTGSPHTEHLRAAMQQVATNPDSIRAIQVDVGNYGWIVGAAGNQHVESIMKLATEQAYRTLIRFEVEALGLDSKYRNNIVKK